MEQSHYYKTLRGGDFQVMEGCECWGCWDYQNFDLMKRRYGKELKDAREEEHDHSPPMNAKRKKELRKQKLAMKKEKR